MGWINWWGNAVYYSTNLKFCLIFFYPHSITSEIPILGLIKNSSQLIAKIYSVFLMMAMFISAITSGYCITEMIKTKLKLNYKVVAAVICALVIPMSSLGFSSLISTLYPVFGYLGLFLLFVIIFQFIKGSVSKL